METRPCDKCDGTGKMPDDAAVGLRLRKKRKALELSVRTVAKKMGYSAPFISDLELGRRHWKPSLERKYLEALK